MTEIRRLKISHFRGVRSLTWRPTAGLNCLAGPGDAGKSTILDAIDWCLGARHSLPVADSDFYRLDVSTDITVEVVLGNLPDELLDLDRYGLFLAGYNQANDQLSAEPQTKDDHALVVRLRIGSDLEPDWQLVSERAEAAGIERHLRWKDRQLLSPIRIGPYADRHLAWQSTSLLNRFEGDVTGARTALTNAIRETKAGFGDSASPHVDATLKAVHAKAGEVGVGVGSEVKALLDISPRRFNEGVIGLHSEQDIPLRQLGLGSSRLLVAGLQQSVHHSAPFLLVDEIEHGLEPHRIVRLLHVLGAKKAEPSSQIFVSTHSPVVIRELAHHQLSIVRSVDSALSIQTPDEASQGQLRSNAEAFLAKSVIVCEGATEVGFVRGLDLHRSDQEQPTMAAAGAVAIDAGGVNKLYAAASKFQALGYRVAVLRDDDKQPDSGDEQAFLDNGGRVFRWSDGAAIEDEIFSAVSDDPVRALVAHACEFADGGKATIEAHIVEKAGESIDLDVWLTDLNAGKRKILASASKAKKAAWFKRIDWMETATRETLADDLFSHESEMRSKAQELIDWCLELDA